MSSWIDEDSYPFTPVPVAAWLVNLALLMPGLILLAWRVL